MVLREILENKIPSLPDFPDPIKFLDNYKG